MPPSEPAAQRDAHRDDDNDPRFSIFDALTDVVVVLDAAGEIIHLNDFAAVFLGMTKHEALGRSIADFLHPEDLVRAFEVMSLMTERDLGFPVTPALYRLKHRDGSWLPLEINAATIREQQSGQPGQMVILGRYSGDRDLQDRILELLTTGAPIPDIVALVPEFGHWRHPHEHYGVLYDDGGHPASAGSPLATQLVALDDSDLTPWARARATGKEVVVEIADLPSVLRDAAHREHLLACWAVPVDDPSTGEAAVLLAWSRDHGPAPTVHRYSLQTMARSLTLILQWRAQLSELERAARHDSLTGVINRAGFFEVLHQVASRPQPSRSERLIGVLYVDLDRFKTVNDEHGHRVGDQVLATAAARIAAAVRAGDVVARLGGDEFAVVCAEFNHDDDLTAVADRIIASVSAPMSVGSFDVSVGASVGIASAPASQVLDIPDALIDDADGALYRAKSQGRGRWHLKNDTKRGRAE